MGMKMFMFDELRMPSHHRKTLTQEEVQKSLTIAYSRHVFHFFLIHMTVMVITLLCNHIA